MDIGWGWAQVALAVGWMSGIGWVLSVWSWVGIEFWVDVGQRLRSWHPAKILVHIALAATQHT